MNVVKYETNYNKKLFLEKSELKFNKLPKKFEEKRINIYPEITYQTIIGFGAAITEAAGVAFSKLPEGKKDQFLKDCYSEEGLNYSLVRLPIGSCDFSLKSYSYASKHNLSDFSIEKDKEYVMPLLKKVKEEKKNLQILSSPWSPPRFMKNTFILRFGGKLRSKHRQTYAEYICKFIEAYKNEGFDIKYITVQNEPNAIQIWESCLYSAEEEADFAINYLAPTLKAHKLDTKILIWDHNKQDVFSRASKELSQDGAIDVIEGVAYHNYTGNHFENLQMFREKYPDKILLHSEGCTGYSNFNPNDEIHNGEYYARDILGDLNSGANGYIDWNVMLDHQGGPNHKKNYCNSPIMLNEDETDYIKNLTYYYIKHFSKFIKSGAKRLGVSRYNDDIEVTSFLNQDNTIAIIVLNRRDYDVEYNMNIWDQFFHDTIESHSILSYVIK